MYNGTDKINITVWLWFRDMSQLIHENTEILNLVKINLLVHYIQMHAFVAV